MHIIHGRVGWSIACIVVCVVICLLFKVVIFCSHFIIFIFKFEYFLVIVFKGSLNFIFSILSYCTEKVFNSFKGNIRIYKKIVKILLFMYIYLINVLITSLLQCEKLLSEYFYVRVFVCKCTTYGCFLTECLFTFNKALSCLSPVLYVAFCIPFTTGEEGICI